MTDDLNIELINKLNSLNNTMKQLRQIKSSRLAMIDPSSGQGKILSALKNETTISQRELLDQVGMKPQSGSEILLKLEKKKYINRTKSDKDKRVYNITLTSDGKKAVQRLSMSESEHLNILSKDQKDQLNKILDTLIFSFDQENETARANFGVNIFGEQKNKKI